MKAIKNLKKKVKNAIYNWASNYYFKETKFRNNWDKTLQDAQTYGTYVEAGFENYKLPIYTPIECIYFALKEVYSDLMLLRITGIRVEYKSNNEILVHIHTERPGYIIGKCGKDIDKLTNLLTEYFGQQVKINIIEEKDLKHITYSFY